jgi:hypothetical protein
MRLHRATRASCSLRGLLQGWEAKVDKSSNRVFYVDHNSRTTTWERPPVPSSGRLSTDTLASGFQPGSGPQVGARRGGLGASGRSWEGVSGSLVLLGV